MDIPIVFYGFWIGIVLFNCLGVIVWLWRRRQQRHEPRGFEVLPPDDARKGK